MALQRYRVRFCKRGDLRFISHRDLVRAFERMFRRAGLKLAFSQGFHPKPKMSFPAALALGTEGANELMELALESERPAEELSSRLAAHALPGLEILGVEAVPPGVKNRVRALAFEIGIPEERRAGLPDRIAELLSQTSHLADRGDGSRAVDLRPVLEELTFCNDRLRMRLLVNDQGGARPRAVLEALGLDDLPQQGHYLVRTNVELER